MTRAVLERKRKTETRAVLERKRKRKKKRMTQAVSQQIQAFSYIQQVNEVSTPAFGGDVGGVVVGPRPTTVTADGCHPRPMLLLLQMLQLLRLL